MESEEVEEPSLQMVVQWVDENGVTQTWLPSDYKAEKILDLRFAD